MKTCLIILIVLMVTLALPGGMLAQESDLAAVAAESVKPLNAGDIDAAMSIFAEDAVVSLFIPGAPETYTGAAQICAWMENLAALHWEGQVEIIKAEGDKVTSRIKTWMDPTRAAGIAPLEGLEEYTFRNGKIVAYSWTPIEETIAKLKKLMAPKSLPQSGGISWPAYPIMMMLLLGGLTLLSGLSLLLLRRRFSKS